MSLHSAIFFQDRFLLCIPQKSRLNLFLAGKPQVGHCSTFGFFSTLLQAIIYISGYSGTNGIRDSLLFSSLWLIPVFLFPKRIKIIAAVIGVVLWAASLAALCYYVIYGQEFSQSVLFVMFETNTNEASEYLSQYFSLKIVLIALAYTAVAVLLWTRLRPVYIPKPWRYVVSFALLYGLILHPIAMNTFIKNKPFEKTLDNPPRVWSLPHRGNS